MYTHNFNQFSMCPLCLAKRFLFVQCKKAVDVGRANRAGFADIGKAYLRMAKSSKKMGDKEQAIAYLEDAQVMNEFTLQRWCCLFWSRCLGMVAMDCTLQIKLVTRGAPTLTRLET